MADIQAPPDPDISSVPVTDRIKRGRALRTEIPRSAHASWSPPHDRADPIALLASDDHDRLPDLIPSRYGRMLASPFAFLRGSAQIMAADLASMPATALHVQACGDAHLANFGLFGTPERNLIFDVNDFDETSVGPWEWDVKRLAVSVYVAGRDNGFAETACQTATTAAVQNYRLCLWGYAHMRYLDAWYSQLDEAAVRRILPTVSRLPTKLRLRQARRRDNLRALGKLAVHVDGKVQLVEDPPLLTHVREDLSETEMRVLFHNYIGSVSENLRSLLSHYRLVDAARKVVGVGSVGRRCFVLLLLGRGDDDPLFIQVKEAVRSVLEPEDAQQRYRNQGERVVRGQQLMQATSDIFLGWGRLAGRDFYLRQLWDMKRAVPVATMSAGELSSYAGLCGWALARAHARSGDAAVISGYMGTGKVFDTAIATFAERYSEQVQQDYLALKAAVATGRVAVRSED